MFRAEAHPMVRWRYYLTSFALLAMTAGLVARTLQGPGPEIRARIDAFVQGVNAGSPEAFEAMAQANFTPEMLARRSPEDRRQMAARLKADFGTIGVERVLRNDDTLELQVKGSTGLAATIALTLEPDPPFRIARMGVEVGGPPQGGGPALPPVPVNPSMNAEQLSSALDRYIAALAANDTFAGSVLVARNGGVMFKKAYGPADRANRVPNTTATRFSIGSINKAFTKTAIGQLIAAGKLSLTDTIGTLLPDYPTEVAKSATVAQLLNHSAGIADFFGDKFAGLAKDPFRSNTDYYRFVASSPVTFPPGSRTQYCNGCYIVLGEIVARTAGIPYEQYVSTQIFQRAGMRNAAFLHTDEPTADVAIGYTRRYPQPGQGLRTNVFMHGAGGSAAGGAYAATEDLLAFSKAMRDGRLLDDRMTTWFYGPDGGAIPAVAGGSRGIGIAGGFPGANASLESDGTWDVVVLANLDPPAATSLGMSIARALRQ
jgi:CubicO group peptidase (beta-lactamase class C family)